MYRVCLTDECGYTYYFCECATRANALQWCAAYRASGYDCYVLPE